MRNPRPILITLLLTISRTTATPVFDLPSLPLLISDFFTPLSNTSTAEDHPLLRKRQSPCQVNYNSCSTLSAPGQCCSPGTTCSRDAASQVACCPTNAVCTGTIIVRPSATSTLSSGVLGSATSVSTVLTSQPTPAGTTAAGGFIVPAGGVASTTAAAGLTTVTAAGFAFVGLPNTFINAQLCSSGYSSCVSEYNRCTVSLGGIPGLTITGGGATVGFNGATATLGQAATSICASLSTAACSGLQLANCAAYGTTGATLGAAAPTGCRMGYGKVGVGIGVVMGVVGGVMG